MKLLMLIVIPVLALPARAEPRDCSKATIRKQRAAADKAIAAKDPAKAIAILEPMVRDCEIAKDGERAWLSSDLAAAYDKAGRPLDCARLVAPLTHPSEHLSAKVVKALDYNLQRCGKAIDAKFAALKTATCPAPPAGAIASTTVPASLNKKPGTCLALLPGTAAPKGPDDDPDIPNVACPIATALVPGAKPQALTGDGALRDESVCCNLDSIAVGAIDGKTLVRVRGHGRDCQGGTADQDTDMIYEWTGAALTPAASLSVTYH